MYLIGQQKQIPFAGFALIKLFSICLHSLPLSSQWNFTAFIHWSSGKRPQLDFNTVPISVYFALAKLIKFYRLLFPPLISKHIYIKMFRSNENMFKSALATIESRNCNTRIFLHSSLIAWTEQRWQKKRWLPYNGISTRADCFVAHAYLPFFKQYRLLYALVISSSWRWN